MACVVVLLDSICVTSYSERGNNNDVCEGDKLVGLIGEGAGEPLNNEVGLDVIFEYGDLLGENDGCLVSMVFKRKTVGKKEGTIVGLAEGMRLGTDVLALLLGRNVGALLGRRVGIGEGKVELLGESTVALYAEVSEEGTEDGENPNEGKCVG